MDGIIPLFKERGMTSHDCVFKMRKILKTKKVGHTGTLDPEVEGVLPICVGRATKLAEYITDQGKEYVATVTLGVSTTTEDATGEVVEKEMIKEAISEEKLDAVLQKLTGEIEQVPPMYSAVKVAGKKLYEYARAGQTVTRPRRLVQIHSLVRLDKGELTDASPSFQIRISCGKGTYIRTLAVMIGEELGLPAHMASLERTKSGFFQKEDCLTLAEIETQVQKGDFSFLHPLEKGIFDMPIIELDSTFYAKVLNGALLDRSRFNIVSSDLFAMMHDEKLVAIYKPHPTKSQFLKPEKVIELKETPKN
ncbi:tRNA pseudouridine synthase B [Listeria fleischmannii 1991]|uniref:tRNA pseudouridine synthase B n=2 Tax=Listeria fleischmannii TaxID=1069827 RepID=A0A2X3J8I8_9LIST|nr:tRNA pseudouridine(55) synthase TruB [Listeria fleischmannii]EMG28169.1 tRNA pseudouridine synthase B [Listeria fleischmannii subsp. fleischmannii LU2006-1]KMT60632.1 tRNA pseudouridine synthase B [Listeria fleischmannii 1991]SQC69369.1 tRNA pseudouridine synthase B [Listeria fleischmannii subsp. fleischmannii]